MVPSCRAPCQKRKIISFPLSPALGFTTSHLRHILKGPTDPAWWERRSLGAGCSGLWGKPGHPADLGEVHKQPPHLGVPLPTVRSLLSELPSSPRVRASRAL